MIFSTNQLWSCAFGFWTMSLGPGTGFQHQSLDNKCGKH